MTKLSGFCLMLALLASFVQGCQPQVIIFAPRVEVLHTPDLTGCVKVETSGGGQASGVIIARRGDDYFCLTARHVVNAATSFKVDGNRAKLYAASVADDVALLKFTSAKQYTVYPVVEARVGEVCWMVGWPRPGRIVNQGRISRADLELVYHNAGGSLGCSGAGLIGLRDGKAVVLGMVTGYVLEHDLAWPIPIRQVYDSIGEAEGVNPIRSMLMTIPAEK